MKQTSRRIGVACARVLASTLSLFLVAPAMAQDSASSANYPSRPITIIVPNPPGSATDTLARMVADGLSASWKQAVVVDNKPGAQGVIGVQAMKKARPDGYTLIISFSGLNSSNPWLSKQLPYHYSKDFTHIASLVHAPSLLLVRVDSPYKTVADLIGAGKRDPAKMVFGYGQATSQVMGSAFAYAAGFPQAVGVSYRGQPQALTDLVGGQFEFLMADVSVSKSFVDTGKVRALGISTKARSALMPELPTLHEQGVEGFDLAAWVGVSGPAGMPAPIVARLNEEIRKVFSTPAARERIRVLGFTPLLNTPAEFQAFVEREYQQWGRAVKEAKIEAQ
jgi:tripartite-type tricarboxylate transporter receptor subunit TctC